MNIKLSQSEICLAQRQTFSIAHAAGVRITARSGVLWLTQDSDPRDVVLQAGESVRFEAPQRVIVQALAPSRVGLEQAQSAPRRSAAGWAQVLAAAVRRLRPPQLAWS